MVVEEDYEKYQKTTRHFKLGSDSKWSVEWVTWNALETCKISTGIRLELAQFSLGFSMMCMGDACFTNPDIPDLTRVQVPFELEAKWPPFSKRDFEMDFLDWKCMNWDLGRNLCQTIRAIW